MRRWKGEIIDSVRAAGAVGVSRQAFRARGYGLGFSSALYEARAEHRISERDEPVGNGKYVTVYRYEGRRDAP